ncbi:MAG: flagellar basal body rod protein FlgC [Pseudomonadota bacterium]
MNFLSSLNISASGLTAQRMRMNVINSNLANMHTTRTAEGGPYVRKDVVFAARSASTGFNDELQDQLKDGLNGVRVVGVINDEKPPLLKYDPNHPDADGRGYVKLPNINLMEEMVNLMSASRSYEANVTAIKATKSMATKALEIGR